MAYDDDSDVMDGILDDDDDDMDLYSASTNPFMKFMPTSLSVTSSAGRNPQHQQRPGSIEPKNEKGVDRLLLMMKYPQAREEEIQEVLKRKEIQQQALQTTALRKGQLFRERRQLEDAERWKQQHQGRDLQKKELSQQEQLKIQEEGRNNIKKHLLRSKKRRIEEHAEGSFSHAVSNSILPRRSFEEADDEEKGNNAVVWQAATDGNDRFDFESGVGKHRSQSVKDNSKAGDYQQESQNSNTKQHRRSKNIIEQTRKSIKNVFGGSSKLFGNVKPLADADGNALVAYGSANQFGSSNNSADNAGDAISLRTTDAYDSRSIGRNNPTSEASVVTQKISNIRSPIISNTSEFDDYRTGNNIDLVNTINNSNPDDLNDEANDKNGWILDRKKNKLLIIIFSLIIIAAVVITVLALLYGQRRQADIDASKSPENQQAGISIGTVEFFPSPSPSSRKSEKVESPEMVTIPPIDISQNDLISAEEDIDELGSNIVSSTTSDSVTTKTPIGDISPSSMPIAAPTSVSILDTISPMSMPTTLPTAVPHLSANPTSSTFPENANTPTNLPTTLISNFLPIERPFLDWVWSEEGNILEGISEFDEHFGQSIALSDDGQTLVIGAPDALDNAGTVRIYEQRGGSWVSTGSLLGRNEGDKFGSAVALSSDGRVLAVSEPSFNGNAGDRTGNIRIYFYSPFGYSILQEIEGEEASDHFGVSISLSSDGQRLAVGAPHHDNGVDNDRLVSGTTSVFQWSMEDNQWHSIGNGSDFTPLIGTDDRDRFGWSIDLNDDGSLLCVGAPRNEKHGGYVQCFEERDNEWKQVGNTIQNKDGLVRYDDQFGATVRMSRDPSGLRHRVAIGVPGKDSENIFNTGHVVVYEFNPKAKERGWIRLGKKVITLENPGKDFRMGFSLDFHEDLLAVGIPGANDGVGKVEVFEFRKDTWEWIQNPTIFDGVASGASSSFGETISMTPSGDFAVGSPQSNNDVGSARFYRRIM